MHLLFRETFGTTGRIDQSNPGTNFTLVRGVFHLRAGGPRLPGTTAASADLRPDFLTPLASYRFTPETGIRVFVCGWYFFKTLQAHGARLLAVTAPTGDAGPTISAGNHGLAAGIEYQTKTPLPRNVLNRWVFLGIAVAHDSGRDGSVRFYAKFPGEPMQSWAGFDHGSLSIASVGGLDMGVNTTNSAIRCRLGAPAAYRFENADFSDVVYPPDLFEPETGLTWYCNPATGNDENDGTAPDRAWASLAKINEESVNTGLLSSDAWETGDTLVIDTSAAPLDAEGKALAISTAGLNVRAAEGNEWIDLKSHRSLPGDLWEPTGQANVYSTTDTQNHIVVWEDDKFLHHPTGASFEAVAATLAATPGSFWTDGVRLYLHPFGSTDPRTDGKRYERSHDFASSAAVALMAPNLHIRDLRAGKTCLARSTDNDSIGAYCLGYGAAPGKAKIAHCYFYYGSKHNIGITVGDVGDDVLLEDVQCEQGSPYVWAGGQTLFVSYNHRPLDLGIIHRFHRCRSVANAGKIGSTEGIMTSYYPVFLSHNIGNPGEPSQFERFEFVDCDFGTGSLHGTAAKQVTITNSTAGEINFGTDVSIERSRILGSLISVPGKSMTARNSLFERSGMLTSTYTAGRLDLQGCVFDGSRITHIQGGVPQAAFFCRSGPLELIFRNNVAILPANAVSAHFFSQLKSTDSLSLSNNAYQLGGNSLVYAYDDGTRIANRSLAEWQTLGMDEDSFLCADPVWEDYRPLPGSPLLNAGVEILPTEDFTGTPFLRRNDIGAFEGPPIRFDEWQFEHFTEEERANASLGGPDGTLFGDSTPNLLKFALGLPARSPAPGAVIRLDGDESQHWIDFSRNRLARDVEWIIESSTDLINWQAVTNSQVHVLDTIENVEQVRLPVGSGTETRFYRLRVSEAGN